MAWGLEECVQRGHHFAIVDEVDSILIDEARTPLIISGPADQNSIWYYEFAKIVPRLRRGEEGEGDYEVDEKKRTVGILETGVAKVEDWLGIENLYDHSNAHLVGFLNNAIKAKELFKKDKDYVVQGGEVLIVDDFTGRILHGRRYSEGMHQAIEAKEGVKIMDENQTLATITLQNYFRLYGKIAGMTGTAMTEANELHQRGLSPVETPEDFEAAWPEAVEKVRRAVAEEHEEVVNLGGLYVLGTERHESRRIDNQLRGRSGRQGDPGESRFYLSFEDDLMRRINGGRVGQFLEWAKNGPQGPIESQTVSRSIRSPQEQLAQLTLVMRHGLLQHDD